MISEIKVILFNDWGPIGVSNNSNLSDEYDSYIGKVVQILLTNGSTTDIINLLKNIERKKIGCHTNNKTLYNVAIKLKNIKTQITNR